MKTIRHNIFKSIFILFLFTGCDELKEALDGQEINLPITFMVSIDTTIPEDLDPNAINNFDSFGTYELLNHPDMVEYAGSPERIKKIRFTGMQYEYKNFSGNTDALVSGSINIAGNINSTSQKNVAESDVLNTIYTINPFAEFEVNVGSGTNVFVRYIGDATHNPAIFRTDFTVSAVVTVELDADDL